MKVSEIKQLIESIVTDEVRKTIMEESNGKKEVYHITCEGIPLATFATEEEANEALPDYKEKHKDGELIIEKGTYNSDEDMLNKLDEMNDQLEETNDMENTEMQPEEGNEFTGALKKAKDSGKDSFEVGGKEYDVEEGECDECGGSYMEEDNDMFENMLRGKRRHSYVAEDKVCEKCGKEVCECGGSYMEEHEEDGDPQYTHVEEDMTENKQMCSECGGMLTSEGECNECGKKMYESKNKTLRLKESELTKLIIKMVNESIPGLDAAKKAHKESGKENAANISAVEKKIAATMKFDGNDNPEFPKAIGKGEKVARKNTPAQEDEIKKNFAGLENLDYDIEPDQKFKDRLKKAIEGHTTMGNAPTTEKTDVKPSNGAKLGEEPKDKDGNVIPTPETAKGIEKQVKNRQKDKDSRELYSKQPVPTTTKKSINEEVEKMKKIFNYNKKTQ
jgi:hypothetical protein